jgi:general secretion pathway protein D
VLQIPFSVINASDTVATTSFGGLLPAGTIVTIRPQIARGDHLLLEYSVQLSSFVGASPSPNLPPPRQENQVQSTVSIPDGYTVVVGGLELVTDDSAVRQVPLLGRLPLVGELFKSRSLSTSRTRFFAFIRAGVLRSESFEDLKHLSAASVQDAQVDDGWPVLEPRIIK